MINFTRFVDTEPAARCRRADGAAVPGGGAGVLKGGAAQRAPAGACRRTSAGCCRARESDRFESGAAPKMLWWPGHRPTDSFGVCSPPSIKSATGERWKRRRIDNRDRCPGKRARRRRVRSVSTLRGQDDTTSEPPPGGPGGTGRAKERAAVACCKAATDSSTPARTRATRKRAENDAARVHALAASRKGSRAGRRVGSQQHSEEPSVSEQSSPFPGLHGQQPRPPLGGP